MATPSPSLETDREVLAGTVERVTFHNADSGFCVLRIKARGRAVESGITLDYLKALEAGYQQLWHEIDQGLLPWGHRIKVETFHWDPMSQMPNWDRHAQSLARSCGIPYTAPENPHTVL